MRQIQIHTPARKAARTRNRADRYQVDLRTPTGRLLRY